MTILCALNAWRTLGRFWSIIVLSRTGVIFRCGNSSSASGCGFRMRMAKTKLKGPEPHMDSCVRAPSPRHAFDKTAGSGFATMQDRLRSLECGRRSCPNRLSAHASSRMVGTPWVLLPAPTRWPGRPGDPLHGTGKPFNGLVRHRGARIAASGRATLRPRRWRTGARPPCHSPLSAPPP